MHGDGSPADASDERSGPRSQLERIDAATVLAPVRMVSFWAAVALPFLHVPLLLRGLSSVSETLTFLGLLSLNLVTLLVGHSYEAG